MKHFFAIVLLMLGCTSYSAAQIAKAESEKYCTYTQGFYGNFEGRACGEIPTSDFITNLLHDDLIIGGGNNSLIITANDVDFLIKGLPGSGPSKTLDGMATCTFPVGIDIENGKIKNSLLAQTITLGLNLRADESLGLLRLKDRKLKTYKAKDCSGASLSKTGKAKTFYLSQSVLDHLNNGNTINDLYLLANKALAGEDIGNLTIWQISSAITVINHSFSEGRIIKGFYATQKESQVDFGDQDMFKMSVFPNPMRTNGKIEFTALESGQTIIELYNVAGERVTEFMNEHVEQFTPISMNIEVGNYRKGMYILYIKNGANIVKEKITIVK